MDESQVREALERFVNAAYQHAVGSSDGGPVHETNRHADVILETARALRRAGQIDALRPLLDHPDPWVVAWAAGYAFEFDPKAAQEACQRLADGPATLTSLSAHYLLLQWQSGSLKLPYAEPDAAPPGSPG